MNELSECDLLPNPCCLQHFPQCWTGCGDEAKVLKRRGMLVGVFCRACYRELAHGIVPPAGVTQSNRMGGKARLRYRQDQAAG